jgi:hypothetical protein
MTLITGVGAVMMSTVMSSSNSHFGRRVQRIAVPLVCVIVFVTIIIDDSNEQTIAVAIAAALLLCYQFLIPLITQRDIKGYIHKLQAHDNGVSDQDAPTLANRIVGYFGVDILRLFGVSAALFAFAYCLGRHNAKHAEDFFVLRTTPEHAVLAIDENIVVLGRYALKTHKLTGEYDVRHLGNGESWVLEKRRLGRLYPPDWPPPTIGSEAQSK